MKILKAHKTFEGTVRFYEHDSTSTRTPMKFSTFTPHGPIKGCLLWLSGLECTEETFMAKAGAFRALSESGLMIVCPDTSPRGLQLPHEHDSWDFGSAASFYVDAVTPGYRDHYRMFTYITEELYSLVQKEFGVADRISIFGHSMGGHGALVLGLRCPTKFRSISAFAPIVNPSACPWGMKAFAGYLGDSSSSDWSPYDACKLLLSGAKHPRPLLVDQGTDDKFLKEQLLTENLRQACTAVGQKTEIQMRPGYDHSYYFISTFVADHIRFHAQFM
jgi:S-formylglutathione hydrolase